MVGPPQLQSRQSVPWHGLQDPTRSSLACPRLVPSPSPTLALFFGPLNARSFFLPQAWSLPTTPSLPYLSFFQLLLSDITLCMWLFIYFHLSFSNICSMRAGAISASFFVVSPEPGTEETLTYLLSKWVLIKGRNYWLGGNKRKRRNLPIRWFGVCWQYVKAASKIQFNGEKYVEITIFH